MVSMFCSLDNNDSARAHRQDKYTSQAAFVSIVNTVLNFIFSFWVSISGLILC